jgi:histidinol-phosphate aminotransferase
MNSRREAWEECNRFLVQKRACVWEHFHILKLLFDPERWGCSRFQSMAQFASFDLSKVARKNILELTPYRCARDDYSDGVLLDANENSFGPAVSSHAHLALNRYPDPLHYEVKQPLAELRGVKKEQIFMGVGSDEAIDILFRIFCDPGKDNVVITPPTYGMYKVCAKVNDVEYKEAPLTPEFDVDMPATLAAIDEHTKLVFLCSPGMTYDI